jgi:hypothetical protein
MSLWRYSTTRPFPFKANSHIPCRSHAALIHPCHAALQRYSDSAVSFVKFRVVDGNARTASPATTLYSNDLRGTPRGCRKKPNAGRSPICRLWTADANSHMPCRAVPWPWEVAFRTAWLWHGMGAARSWQDMCESNTAALCKSNEKDRI